MGPDKDPWLDDEEDVEEEDSAWSVVQDPSDDPQNYYWLDGVAYRLPEEMDDDED